MRLFLASQGLGALPAFLGDVRDVLYVPTAAKPMSGRNGNGEILVGFGHRVVELDIDGAVDLSALDVVDAVFVEGGSPFFLLQAMRESGFDSAVTQAVRGGLPYVGMSAGAVVAGPDLEPLSTTSNTARRKASGSSMRSSSRTTTPGRRSTRRSRRSTATATSSSHSRTRRR